MDYSEIRKLEKKYSKYVDIPWNESKLRMVGGCYEIIKEFYLNEFNIVLNNYETKKEFLFSPDIIEQESKEHNYTTIYSGTSDQDLSSSLLEFGDLLIMKLYLNPLSGGYSKAGTRYCNHCGICLGHDCMLHHPFQCNSSIEYLKGSGNWYLTNTELVIRLNSN